MVLSYWLKSLVSRSRSRTRSGFRGRRVTRRRPLLMVAGVHWTIEALEERTLLSAVGGEGASSELIIDTALGAPNTAPLLDDTSAPALNAILKDPDVVSGMSVSDIVVDGSITDPNIPLSVTFQEGATSTGAVTIRQWDNVAFTFDDDVNQDGLDRVIIGFNEPSGDKSTRELLRGLFEFDLSTLVTQIGGQPFDVEGATLVLHRSVVGDTLQGTGYNHPFMTLEARLYDFDFGEEFATWANPSAISDSANDGDTMAGGALSTVLSTASFEAEASLGDLPDVTFADSSAFRTAIDGILGGGDTLRLLVRATDAIESEAAGAGFDSHFVRFDSDDHATVSQRPKLEVSLSAPEAIAVTGVDDTNGTWQYSTDGGTNWLAFSGPAPAAARLLGPTEQVRFVPDPGFSGNAEFTFLAWDQTSGTAGGMADTTIVGSTAFSVTSDTASINVVSLLAPDLVPFAFSDGVGPATDLDSPIVIRTTSQLAGTSASVITTADPVIVDSGYLNIGNASTGSNWQVSIQLDGNTPITNTIGPAGPRAGLALTPKNFGTLSAGIHTLTARADSLDAITESVEANNIFIRTFIVEAVGTADFGDAPTSTQSGFPSSYPTLTADGGASHTIVSGFRLGANIDPELDGRASLMAIDDDDDRIGTGLDDEDGVTINGALVRGSTHSFDVDVTNTAGLSNPYLDAWVDFNQDGDWTDPGEQVFSGAVAAGANSVSFLVPASAVPGQTYARFRLHDGTAALTPGGAASDGEVEDHLVEVQSPGNWVDQGPAPVQNGQIENVDPQNQVTGAMHTVLAHPTDADILYAGSVNGGIWKTTNATATSPFWTPQTDFLESLSISAMAFDPSDGTSNTLVAATGRFTSFAGIAGASGRVYRTTDGGLNWSNPGSAGLAGENISGIAARGNTIVVTSLASGGGILRSTDSGATFSAITSADFVPGNDFFDLVADPTDGTGQRLYAAGIGVGGSGGIYRSDDFGLTWTKVTGPGINATMDTLLAASNAIEMTVHPATGRLYVAILVNAQPQGLFHTNNGTSATPTWTQMDVPVLPLSPGVPLTNATFATPIVITSTGHGLSTDNFVVISGVLGNTAANGFFRVTVIDANTFSLDLSSGNAAYASGGSWTRVTGPNPSPKDLDASSQGRLHFSIVVDPSNEDILYVGGDRQDRPGQIGATTGSGSLFRGNAGLGRNPTGAPSPQWDHLTHYSSAIDVNGGTAGGSSPHADSREMVFDANGNLMEVDDGGIFKRTNPQDNTGDWFSLAGNLGTLEFHSVAYDSLTNTIIAGTQDNGTQTQQIAGGTVWDLFSGGDGGDVAIDNIVNAPSNQSVRYTSSQLLGFQNGVNVDRFIRTVFDANNKVVGSSPVKLTVNGGGAPLEPQFITPVRTNNAAGNRLLIVGDNSIYESLDGGSTITEVGPGFGPNVAPPPGFVQNAVDYGTAGNVNAAYVGRLDKIAVRTTAGATFSVVDPSNGSTDFIEDVVMDPANFNTAFAIDSNQLFRTTDAGSAWTDVTGNLMSLAGGFLQSMTFVPGVSDMLVVGGALGVFAAQTSSLSTWVEVGNNLPNAIVFDLDYDAADDVLLAGTLGRGAWLMHEASTAIGNLFSAPQVINQAIEVNGVQGVKTGLDRLTFAFNQAVTVSSATSLKLFNHTTGQSISLASASLSSNGTSSVTWDMSSVTLPNGRYTAELPATTTTSAFGLPLAQTHTFEFHKLAGDVDGDGFVNFNDFFEVDVHFNTFGSTFLPGDADGDGFVNFNDFFAVDANFNTTVLPTTLDFGDAPDSATFPTTLANDGARHVITGNALFLGTARDGEADGQSSLDATGDDTGGSDDEDGIPNIGLDRGTNVPVTVTASVPATAVLNGWVDFNQDGDWDDAGEQVFINQAVSNGPNSLSIPVPAEALLGPTFARFRITETAGYSYFGLAPDGEVEDYQLTVTGPAASSPLTNPTDLLASAAALQPVTPVPIVPPLGTPLTGILRANIFSRLSLFSTARAFPAPTIAFPAASVEPVVIEDGFTTGMTDVTIASTERPAISTATGLVSVGQGLGRSRSTIQSGNIVRHRSGAALPRG